MTAGAVSLASPQGAGIRAGRPHATSTATVTLWQGRAAVLSGPDEPAQGPSAGGLFVCLRRVAPTRARCRVGLGRLRRVGQAPLARLQALLACMYSPWAPPPPRRRAAAATPRAGPPSPPPRRSAERQATCNPDTAPPRIPPSCPPVGPGLAGRRSPEAPARSGQWPARMGGGGGEARSACTATATQRRRAGPGGPRMRATGGVHGVLVREGGGGGAREHVHVRAPARRRRAPPCHARMQSVLSVPHRHRAAPGLALASAPAASRPPFSSARLAASEARRRRRPPSLAAHCIAPRRRPPLRPRLSPAGREAFLRRLTRATPARPPARCPARVLPAPDDVAHATRRCPSLVADAAAPCPPGLDPPRRRASPSRHPTRGHVRPAAAMRVLATRVRVSRRVAPSPALAPRPRPAAVPVHIPPPRPALAARLIAERPPSQLRR